MALDTLQFWQQQLAIHQAAQAAAQGDLTLAQQAQTAAAARLATDLKTMTATGAAIAAQRALLATTPVPADASALIAAITTQLIAQRNQQGTVLDDQDAVADAAARADAATSTLTRTQQRVAAAQAAIATATADVTARGALKTAIAAAPLATLKTDAAALLASATATNAKACIDGDFPAAIQAIAAKRRATRLARVASLQATTKAAVVAQATEAAADGGLAGTVQARASALQLAQATLADAVATAASRYGRALSVLQRLEAIKLDTAGTLADILSAAEKAQLTALAGLGAAAEPTAEALDTDMTAVQTALDDVDAQVLTQIGTDVDQLATDATLAAKRAAVGTAQTAFASALAAFAAANKNDLDQWEAVIPDPAWATLLDYDGGLADLATFAALDLPALATAMDSAETDYTTALAASEKAAREAGALGDAVRQRQARLGAARAALDTRLSSAIRGDSY